MERPGPDPDPGTVPPALEQAIRAWIDRNPGWGLRTVREFLVDAAVARLLQFRAPEAHEFTSRAIYHARAQAMARGVVLGPYVQVPASMAVRFHALRRADPNREPRTLQTAVAFALQDLLIGMETDRYLLDEHEAGGPDPDA